MKKTSIPALLMTSILSLVSISIQAQPSLNNPQDIATFAIINETQSDATFVQALSEECAKRYKERSLAWRKVTDAYLTHFKETHTLINAQYMKTLGIAVPKRDYNQRVSRILIQQMENSKADWDGICNIASSPVALKKLIEAYPLDRSEKSINALIRAIETGDIDRLASRFNDMSSHERNAFAVGFLATFGK